VLNIIPVFYNAVCLPSLFLNEPAVDSLSVLIKRGSQGLLLRSCSAESIKYEPNFSCTEIVCRKQTENRPDCH
jgi:hypothetical protein